MKQLIYETLEKYFGYKSFREYQEDIILSMMGGRDTLAIMPTGAGKSLCYQLPAILSEGTTIVVSPLISLMKDQVDYLENIGVPSVYLNSSLSSSEYKERLRGIYNNQYKIIYAAPERLETEGFIQSVNALKSPCTQLIIDEAHCVSRWGHDFRPSYTKIIDFIELLANRPTISAFTATATDTVKKDIEESLGLREPNRFITGFDRANLEFKVSVNIDKDRFIKAFVKDNSADTGIIYTATRKEANRLNELLKKQGMECAVYHAGLSDEERNQAQEDFIYDNISVLIATNAFGMGIDKSNVRYVIHYNMPRDLESYYQEAGRAGRDGLPSVCILLYSAGDTAVQKYFIDEADIPEERKSLEYKKLQIMESYCHTDVCLRRYILEYFGDYSSSGECGNCSVCSSDYETRDVTLQSQMILSCIHRSGQRFGRSIIVDTLRGSKNKRILGFRLDGLKTYGLMSNDTKDDIELLLNKLIAEGYIHKTEEQYPVLKLTQKSIPLLKNQGTVTMQIMKKKVHEEADNGLLVLLKQQRKKVALREGYPPYVIFHDAALVEMSSSKPVTLEEFAYIKGVGENRKNKYGEEFIQVIKTYMNPSPKKEGKAVSLPYVDLYKEGKSLDEVAAHMGVSITTAENNVLKAYAEGVDIDLSGLIQKDYELSVAAILLEDNWDGKLKTIKERLPMEVTYSTIKGVIEKLRRRLM